MLFILLQTRERLAEILHVLESFFSSLQEITLQTLFYSIEKVFVASPFMKQRFKVYYLKQIIQFTTCVCNICFNRYQIKTPLHLKLILNIIQIDHGHTCP